jgi:hypothetical protein
VIDERVVTQVLYIDGGSGDLGPHYLPPGASILDWAREHGVTFRLDHRTEPWTQAELDRGSLESRVAELREEFPGGDFPSPIHPPDEPCTECEALRFLDRV